MSITQLTYLDSTKVKLYPSAYRGSNSAGKRYNPDSRLATEDNMANIANKLTDIKNYIIDYSASTDIMHVCIEGRYFELNLSDIVSTVREKYIHAIVLIKSRNPDAAGNSLDYDEKSIVSLTTTSGTQTPVNNEELDSSDSKFTGLGLYYSDALDISADLEPQTSLCILVADGTNYVPYGLVNGVSKKFSSNAIYNDSPKLQDDVAITEHFVTDKLSLRNDSNVGVDIYASNSTNKFNVDFVTDSTPTTKMSLDNSAILIDNDLKLADSNKTLYTNQIVSTDNTSNLIIGSEDDVGNNNIEFKQNVLFGHSYINTDGNTQLENISCATLSAAGDIATGTGLTKKVTWKYGSVKNAYSGYYNGGEDSGDQTITIPKDTGDLNNSTGKYLTTLQGSDGWHTTTTVIKANDNTYNIKVNTDGNTSIDSTNTLVARDNYGKISVKDIDVKNNITFSDSVNSLKGIQGTVGNSDVWRVVGGSSGTNLGYLELATADNGDKPIYVRQNAGIYVRQYAGNQFNSLVRQATILDANGNTIFPNQVRATNFYASSDARKKENIQDFVYEKSILDLPIKRFDYIEGAKNQIGCLAQDLQKLYPELVSEGEDGFLSIQESKLVYLLLEEVRELKEQIKLLKGE